MSRLGLPKGWSPCENRPASSGQGMNMAAYFGQAVNCPPASVIPPWNPELGPLYFISTDWDACLIDGVHEVFGTDSYIADGVLYQSPNWPAGNYCNNGGPPWPYQNPGNSVDGLVVYQQLPSGMYLGVAATGWYLYSGEYVGTEIALIPPGVQCTQNNDPVPTPPNCECCAGAPTDLGGVIWCQSYTILTPKQAWQL